MVAARGLYSGRLASNLRALRTAAGWSQETVAEKCGLTVRMVTRIEGARVATSVDVLGQLCEGLGLEPNALLAPADPPQPRPKGRPRKDR